MLDDALADRKMSQAALERELEVSAGLVRRWLRGEKMPTAQNITRIFDLLHVPADAWGREPRRSRAGSAA